jgi:hypothetical protein
MEKLICNSCKQELVVSMFGKNKAKKNGYKGTCRSCVCKRQRELRNKQREEDPEKFHERWHTGYLKVRDKKLADTKERLSNPENRAKKNDYIRKYKAERRLVDKGFVLYENLRKRIWASIKKKKNSSLELLGCNINLYLEWIKFTMSDDMSWENYGKIWNIDHIIPISSFDLENENEIKLAFNWKNTWAMYSTENFKKKNKLILDYIPLHSDLLTKFCLINNITN